jgi:hypothetical protein
VSCYALWLERRERERWKRRWTQALATWRRTRYPWWVRLFGCWRSKPSAIPANSGSRTVKSNAAAIPGWSTAPRGLGADGRGARAGDAPKGNGDLRSRHRAAYTYCHGDEAVVRGMTVYFVQVQRRINGQFYERWVSLEEWRRLQHRRTPRMHHTKIVTNEEMNAAASRTGR